VPHELSIIALVGAASWPVKGVLLILLILSVLSWAVIFEKATLLGRTRRDADRFERRFWSGQMELVELYREYQRKKPLPRGFAAVFLAGFQEFARLHRLERGPGDRALAGAERAMRSAILREEDRLGQNLGFLATVGSTSPYIGLFGTVWGIMIAFHALGEVEQATLALVAPGISEALVATAMGLVAAIPASIAYNRYLNVSEQLLNRYEAFLADFSGLLQREARGADDTTARPA